ncbi:hypothetical protein GOV06_04700, partial [Candidatus Woesearchaeota archaeon]|nr:hypothetical protein [Candidatus Woesearchaeota archaeon]
DVKALSRVNSATYGEFMLTWDACKGYGYRLACFNLSETCERHYKKFRLEELIPFYGSEEEFLKHAN